MKAEELQLSQAEVFGDTISGRANASQASGMSADGGARDEMSADEVEKANKRVYFPLLTVVKSITE